MKKMIIGILLASSTLVLTGCGVVGTGGGCCRTAAVATCPVACNTVAYTYSGGCTSSLCASSWY